MGNLSKNEKGCAEDERIKPSDSGIYWIQQFDLKIIVQ
jgi:hypothetical protein